jgi:hypothetical protein
LESYFREKISSFFGVNITKKITWKLLRLLSQKSFGEMVIIRYR